MNSVAKLGYCITQQDGQKCPACKEEKKYLHQPFKHLEFSVCSLCFDSVKTSGAEFYKNNQVFVPQSKMDETISQCKIEEDTSQCKMDETSSQNKIEEDTSQCKMDDNAPIIKEETIYIKYLIILILVCIACVLV